MIKKCVSIVLILAALAGIIVFFACGRQIVHCVTGINNLDHYYILKFERMNREDFYLIPACKDDVFSVNFRILSGLSVLCSFQSVRRGCYGRRAMQTNSVF